MMFTDANDRLTAETAFQEWLSELSPDQREAYWRQVEQDRQRDLALMECWPVVDEVEGAAVEG